MPTYTQADRFISVETPLGTDVLLLRSFTGDEGISQLFSFELDLLSEDSGIKFEKIIGQRISVKVRLLDEKERHFNGFVSSFVQTGIDAELSQYRATMVPWLWFLTRTADCRIFQEMTVPDIILKIFSDLGFTDVKNDLQGSWDPLDYCVQYRETDFNFVSRLMEQYGICYFFEHEASQHTLVLANTASSYKPCPEQPTARWDPEGSAPSEEDVVLSLQIEREFRPGKYALTDYNFETPSTSLMAEVQTAQEAGGNGKFEIYDYPGEYKKKAQGDKIVKIRIEEEEAQYVVIRGGSLCRAFTSGFRFDLKDYFRADMNQSYLLTQIQHAASIGEAYRSSEGGSGQIAYSNTFTAVPHKIPYRPARLTPKPIVQGLQTAVVVGPGGEEIYVDKYGRAKVQFFWDREGKRNEGSSCWVRVSQLWAGKNWGAMFIPRIGQEVIVEFIEGDPDHPIITGRVYNAEMMPPYALPANQTQSGIKSNSSKGGGGSNELRFEDKKGSEEVYLHGQKDWNILIENDKGQIIGHDETLHVKNDRTKLIDHDENSEIKNDRNKTVGVNQSESIGGSKSIKVGGGHTEEIDGAMTISVGSTLTETVTVNYAEAVGGAMELMVGGALTIAVGAAMAETVGGAKAEAIGLAKSENIGGNKSVNVGKDLNESVGKNQDVKIVKDLTESIGGQHKESVTKEYILNAKKIQIVAEDEINIKAGSAEIVMKKNGDITINGKKIKVEGSGDVIVKGSKVAMN